MTDPTKAPLLDPAITAAIITVAAGAIGWVIQDQVKRRRRVKELASKQPAPLQGPVKLDRITLRGLRVDDGHDVEIRLKTFKPRLQPNDYSKWADHSEHSVGRDAVGDYVLKYDDIESWLADPAFPFKPYLRVPVALRNKYSERLCEADCIVTGRGDADPGDPKYWRVWFLFPMAKLHPDIEDLFRLNHCIRTKSVVVGNRGG